MARNALVIGSELLTRFLDFNDRNTCILFGDGAGAVVLSASDEEGGGLGGLELTADPSGAWSIWIPAGGARRPTSGATVTGGEHYLRMDGRETYRYATRTIAASALTAVERAGWTAGEVDLIVPHQANLRIIESVAKGLGIPMDRFFIDLDRYGNTSAASVPIALSEAVDAGRLQPGHKVVFVAFGAGFTSGAAAVTWTADPASGRRADDVVPGRIHPPARGLGCRRPDPATAGGRARGQAQDGGTRMIDLTGKSAVVTGGSRGIGRAIALRLAEQGADVAFSYKGNAEAAAETVAAIEALGRRGLAIQADVAQPDSADALIKEVLAVFAKVDILVNNAGITRDDLIMRMSIDAWREVIDTNLSGAFYATKAVTRPMLKARSGRIINITSVSGQAGQMGQANYSSAKAGLIGLTKATARELASRGITVNAVAPGFRGHGADPGPAARSSRPSSSSARRWAASGDHGDRVGACAFLASDEAAYITGQVLAVDGGLVMM